MAPQPAVAIDQLRHRYGEREALRGISLSVERGDVLGLLGPNGGGKTTLFRILATSLTPCGGRARILDHDVVQHAAWIRRRIGVVFQAPSLDRKLTAAENLKHHGHLYGIRGRTLRSRIDEMLDRVGLLDRAGDRIEHLSGGQQRRVEVAKGLLHRPEILLMDEPSTGLDPGARRDLWEYLRRARETAELTILLTTHLMDEAQKCQRVAILHHGAIVADGAPDTLTGAIGAEVVCVESDQPEPLAEHIRAQYGLPVAVVDGMVRIERELAHRIIPQLLEAWAGRIGAVTVRRPSLDDVFVHHTGHRFWAETKER